MNIWTEKYYEMIISGTEENNMNEEMNKIKDYFKENR